MIIDHRRHYSGLIIPPPAQVVDTRYVQINNSIGFKESDCCSAYWAIVVVAVGHGALVFSIPVKEYI